MKDVYKYTLTNCIAVHILFTIIDEILSIKPKMGLIFDQNLEEV